MQNKKRPQKSAREIFQKIATSQEFLEHKARSRNLGRVAFDAVALEVAENIREQNRGYDDDESRQIRLAAVLSDWIQSQRKLDEERDQMTRSEKKQHLGPVIRFNHIIREMVDAEQYTKMSEITRFIQESLLHMGAGRQTIGYAASVAQMAINGMRHEIAAESIFNSIDGVREARGADTDEELAGKDVVVDYAGIELAFDIKASKKAADEAMSKSRRGDYMAIWSGFRNDDFGDSLLLSDDQLDEKKAYYAEVLDYAASQSLNPAIA